MAETIRKDAGRPTLGGKRWFALGLLKDVVKKGPAQEKRLKELEETIKNEKLIGKYGKKNMEDAVELSRSSEANATHAQAAFYFYVQRGDEFIMQNLLQYLKAYNKGEAKKFLTEMAKEARIMKMPEDDKKYLGEIAKIALAKNDEQAVVFVCQLFLSYIDRRNRKKDPEYSEAKELKEQVELLREW